MKDVDDKNFENNYEEECEYSYNDFEDEPGWGCYDEYGGPCGYDDFTIDSAFDGEPDAVWNVD